MPAVSTPILVELAFSLSYFTYNGPDKHSGGMTFLIDIASLKD